MKFGSVENPELVDFTLPKDHPDTEKVLKEKGGSLDEIYVGCAKWNKQDLKAFYPRGTKDELAYYSQQFNSIELNATFYNNYGSDQIQKWTEKVPVDFRFFPKVNNYISHIKRLNEIEMPLEEFCTNIRSFDKKLGMAFLQLHDNFGPKNKDRLEEFLKLWHADLPLAVELRNTAWFNEEGQAEWVYDLFEYYNVANIIADTAGRRDLLHMRLTSPVAFVRYVGANHESDYQRLDDWIERIKEWKTQGLQKLYFFVHQNLEKASPYLSAYFIENLNKAVGSELIPPTLPEDLFSGKKY
ncbi:hypothetical protein GCM10011506_39360 [Marivirga lumbricoides]|uniref:DUF72 domain-containing protein n=1 Tax=Marivirga lumbricoides TaxID=1046115 RepID=A0ABQ1N098_9BACT|nr:hypothetical protein GCM10011506_39360 [Marivirga lumbricoides]